MQKRKSPRLQEYDYSTAGAYFLTICTLERRNLFWLDGYKKENQSGYPACLNTNGRMAFELVQIAAKSFADLIIHKFVVMPNHIHLLIQHEGSQGRQTNISEYIAVLKSLISKEIHKADADVRVWQRSFYDRVMRNEEEMERVSQYIDANPENWMEAKETPDF
ncbi:MAG TPA: transposase [Anaerolineaceae bacterium]|nr:transposase [Anaerolineaceae bacterium]